MKRLKFLFLFCFLFLLELNVFSVEATSDTLRLEIPSAITDRNSQIIYHLGYTVSFNADWQIPNWVAYELTKEEVEGVIPRSNKFLPDPLVKGGMATTKDYVKCGYDRGHMAPAADMKWSEQAMAESFYLSNICPQNKNLNRGDWNDLEEAVRVWAKEKEHVYIVCGPIVSNRPQTIGYKYKIAVPESFFKVILSVSDENVSAIGFIFPNNSGNNPLSTYVVTIDEVERVTKMNFFPKLPNNIEEKAESTILLSDWNL